MRLTNALFLSVVLLAQRPEATSLLGKPLFSPPVPEASRPRMEADLEVIENMSYHALCLLYKGERTVDDVLKAAGEGPSGSAVRYGVSIWHLYNGRAAEARTLWDSLTSGPDWPSFGYIAAEAELARKR